VTDSTSEYNAASADAEVAVDQIIGSYKLVALIISFCIKSLVSFTAASCSKRHTTHAEAA